VLLVRTIRLSFFGHARTASFLEPMTFLFLGISRKPKVVHPAAVGRSSQQATFPHASADGAQVASGVVAHWANVSLGQTCADGRPVFDPSLGTTRQKCLGALVL